MQEIHNNKLEILSNDDIAMEAISQVFNEVIKENRPNVGEANNNLLGAKYRAYEEARNMVKKGIQRISEYKLHKTNNNSFNKEN